MIAFDTNVLVRVLVDDPGEPDQVKAAREKVRRAREVFIPQIVQAETVWVLTTAYGFDKPAVLNVLHHLLENQAFSLQRETTFEKALELYGSGSADFSDYLIHEECESVEIHLLTFDRRLAKSAGVSLIKSE